MSATARKHKLLTSSVFAAVLLTGFGSARAEVDALVREARALLDKGQAEQAFNLLEPMETPRAGDPDFDTVLGISAVETKQFTRAIFALERVLAVQPENSRARAELGRALFSVGDIQNSRKVLLETKRDNIPPEAAATIDQFLQAIDRSEEASRSSVRGYVEGSLGYDSNVNSGPTSPNVAVPLFGGLIFTLNGAAVKNSSDFASFGAGLSGRYVLDPRWSLIGNFSALSKVNAQASSFNSFQVDGNAGASYRYDKHEFSGVFQAGTYDVSGNSARHQGGVVGEWTYRPDGFRQLSTYIQYGSLKYPGQRLRDVDRTVVGTSYAHDFRNSFLAFGGIYAGTEEEKTSGVQFLGHRLYGIRGGGQKQFSASVAMFGSVGYENRKYGGQDPLFLVTRKDDQFNLNLGLNWVPAKFWRVTPILSLTKVNSNVAISDYDRKVFSVTLRRDF